MASNWLTKILDELKDLNAVREKPHTGSNHQLWRLGKRMIALPVIVGRDVGHVRWNAENKARQQIKLYFQDNPGLKERLEKERKEKGKGMRPADVDSWAPLGPKVPVVETVAAVPEPIAVPSPPPVVEVPPVIPEPDVQPEMEPEMEPEMVSEPVASLIASLTNDVPDEPMTLQAVAETIRSTPASEPFINQFAVSTKEDEMPKGKPAGKVQLKCVWGCTREPFELPQGLGRHVKQIHPEYYEEYKAKYTQKKSQHAAGIRGKTVTPKVTTPPTAIVIPTPDRLTPGLDTDAHISELFKTLVATVQEIAQELPKLLHENRELARRYQEFYDKYEAIQQLVQGHQEHEQSLAKGRTLRHLQR